MNKYASMLHDYAPKQEVAVVGVRGYSGLELTRILLRHPYLSLVGCYSTDKELQLSDLLPDTAARSLKVEPVARAFATLDSSSTSKTVFLCTPAEASLDLAPKFLKAGCRVIDLSGAFRLKTSDYKKWYGFEHEQKDLLEGAHYGLSPFAGPAKSSLIANPGCFATAVLMAVIPLLKHQLIDPETLVVDAKSGTTGAGKKALENMLFSEVDGNCTPYRVGQHQHFPEIQEATMQWSGCSIDPHFVTHLLPVRRGILAGIYARIQPGVTLEAIREAYQQSFGCYPLVEWGAVGTDPLALQLKHIVGSAKTKISYQLVDRKLYVFSVLDNLLKGAASQAVENMNAVLDLPLQTGLESLEGNL